MSYPITLIEAIYFHHFQPLKSDLELKGCEIIADVDAFFLTEVIIERKFCIIIKLPGSSNNVS